MPWTASATSGTHFDGSAPHTENKAFAAIPAKTVPALGDDLKFNISERMVRGWGDLKEKWLRKPEAPPEDLLDIIGREQTRLRGRFGVILGQ